ncbi:hypothetical protein D3C73_1188750 [compost metagenome]
MQEPYNQATYWIDAKGSTLRQSSRQKRSMRTARVFPGYELGSPLHRIHLLLGSVGTQFHPIQPGALSALPAYRFGPDKQAVRLYQHLQDRPSDKAFFRDTPDAGKIFLLSIQADANSRGPSRHRTPRVLLQSPRDRVPLKQ